ncbi:hypothetical protein [Natronoglycomyces albus]|uniref:Uncharacterized protein n=1 Tax=Natronoglycomyces albus TaxID=2811108 RepID=A0A895XLQ6_9ACTN|nr:hypothetical protein [Natronoglycomyces albus]QSB06274.1 hypothetical protein JQS30_05030 [Natronoglycomyces albus]
MSVIVPILAVSAIQTLTLGLFLPLLMMGPLIAGGRPSQRQLMTAAALFIPTLFIGSGLLLWWAVSWLSAAGAPGPGWTATALIFSVIIGLLAPIATPGPPGSMPFYLRPTFGLLFGLLAGVAMVELQEAGLAPILAAFVLVGLLAIALLLARLIAVPLTVRHLAKRVHKFVSRFEGQLVDVDAEGWTVKQLNGNPSALQMVFQGPMNGRQLAVVIQVRRDMDWVPKAQGNDAVVFELAQGFAGRGPIEAVLAQQRVGSPATLTFRIPNTTIISIREVSPDSIPWGQFVGMLRPVEAEEFLNRHGDPGGSAQPPSSSGASSPAAGGPSTSENDPRTIEGEATDVDDSPNGSSSNGTSPSDNGGT